MKRFLAVTLTLLAAFAVDARQFQRYLQQEPLVENLAESTIHRIENRGEVIIELDVEPVLGRTAKSLMQASSELEGIFERLEKDLRAIELDLDDRVSVRSIAEPSGIHHRYTMAFAGASATVHPETIDAIRALSYVRAVHPDRGVRAYLQDSVAQVGASQVWSTHGNRGAGIPVDAALTSTFDTRNEDSFPPVMTSMRLTDGIGRTGAVFATGSAPMVAFSVVDFGLSGYARPAGERTRVEYRRYVPGDGAKNTWTALTAVEIGDDLDDHQVSGAPDGVLYRVDLTEVAATLSGAVDLRIIIEDTSGNTTTYVLEPALLIDSDGRRRSVTRR